MGAAVADIERGRAYAETYVAAYDRPRAAVDTAMTAWTIASRALVREIPLDVWPAGRMLVFF